jgi:hypothetical protein
LTAKNQAAVNGHRPLGEQLQLAAHDHEAAADVADSGTVVVPEVGNGFEVRRQATREPHELDVALALVLQPSAGLDAIEVAVDVDLQQDGGVVGRPPCAGRCGAVETQLLQVELVDEGVNHPDRVVLGDEVVQALRHQGDLTSLLAFDESLHGRLARCDASIYPIRGRFHTGSAKSGCW